MVNLIWHNEPAWDKSTTEAEIRRDLSQPIYEGMLDNPSQLITHTVFLGRSYDEGPVVHVWGEEGDDDNLHCEWADDIKWVTLKEMEITEDNHRDDDEESASG